MERELMPDYSAEEFYRYLIPPSVFEGTAKARRATNHCIVFCKKTAPHLFSIQKGVAIVNEAGTSFNDGICLIVPETKVVFVFSEG